MKKARAMAVLVIVAVLVCAAFAEEVVRNSGYRWFVIKCGDGTGIVHAGSYYACAVYGKLDTDGCIAEPYGYIYLTDNGFIYEE